MGDVGPPGAVALGDLDGVAEQLLLRLAPTARRSGRPTARPRSRRAVCTRCSKRFIAIWRKTVAIEPSIDLRQQRRAATPASAAASSRRPNTSVSPNTDAVSASVSGVAMVEDALRRAERRVHAVAELVRERQHVAARDGVVEQHVRVHATARV